MTTWKVVRLDDREYTLFDAPLARGGQAEIYAVREDNGVVVKVYHDDMAYTAEERRIVAMRGMRPLAHPTLPVPLAWPTAVARDRESRFRGYAMRRFDRAEHAEIGLLIDPARRSEIFGDRAGWRNLLIVAQNVADAVDRIHRENLVVGDLSDRNILVSLAAGHPTFLDCDSMGFTDRGGRHFPPRMQTPGYVAPERMTDRGTGATKATDRFALAILIYQLLTEGHHPFTGQSTSSEAWEYQDNIEHGNCFLIDPGRFAAAGYPARPGAFILPRSWVDPKALPHRVTEMAEKAFGAGLRRPASRPTARDWWYALEDALGHVNTCSQYAGHTYAEHLRTCPWCERANRVTATMRRPHRPLDQVAPAPPPPPPAPLPPVERRSLPPVERPLPYYQPQQQPPTPLGPRSRLEPPSPGSASEDTVADPVRREGTDPTLAGLFGVVAIAVVAIVILVAVLKL